MSDMYASVRKDNPKKPRRHGWLLALLAAVLVLIVIGVKISLPLIYNYAVYPDFTESLLSSEYYAYQNDCLRAEIDGQSVHVGRENIGPVCVQLILNPPDQLGFVTPDREAELLLDFGDGSVLRLWTDTLRGGEEGKAVRFLFEGADGSRYHFLTDNISVSRLAMPARAFQTGNTALD